MVNGREEYQASDWDSSKALVLKVLSPYFVAGRFTEKSLFKEMAKKLTEILFQEMRCKNFITVKTSIKRPLYFHLFYKMSLN